MNRRSHHLGRAQKRIPRTRGDEPDEVDIRVRSDSIPRTRGDEPLEAVTRSTEGAYSPHPRG